MRPVWNLFRRRRRFAAVALLPSGERQEAELLARDLASAIELAAWKVDSARVEMVVVGPT
jgi:hypothetical protein